MPWVFPMKGCCCWKVRNAGKTVFWVFLTMHYLKSPICFLISISRKLKSPSRILHCRKQLMSEEKWGKLKVPRFSGKTGGIHTFSKFRWLFTYHNSPGKANELQNEIILKEKRCHKGLFPAVKNKYIKPIKTQFRGLGLGYTFRLGYMPYKTGKGIMYLISRKIEFKFSFQPEIFFFSVKSHFSFLFSVFLAFLLDCLFLT